jgi:hypothetical protein
VAIPIVPHVVRAPALYFVAPHVDIDMSIDALHAGDRIEVLWDITEGKRKTSVWWTAAIATIGRPGGDGRIAKVAYDAQHGYSCTSSSVCFRNVRDLETIYRGGRKERHLWRRVESVSSDSSESSIPRVRGTSTNGEDIGSHHVGREPARYEQLASRVHGLEHQVQELLSHRVGSLTSAELQAARPLAFARHRVGLELEKPLSFTAASVRRHAEAHTVVAQTFKVQVDCTLAEFEGICQISTALESAHGQVSFSPCHPSVQSSRFCETYKIIMPSYAVLCGVLGVPRREEIEATVKVKRCDRRSKSPVVVRILGALQSASSPSGEDPMVLAVSQSVLACMGSQQTLHVLYRRTSIWDPVEGSFAERLVVKEMPLAEMSRPNAEDDDSSTSAKNVHAFAGTEFMICWERTSQHAEGAFEPYEASSVLGKLSICIPYALFRGHVLCQEVDLVCSESFIKKTMR